MEEKIRKDMTQALKEKDVVKKETLRLVLSEIKKEQIDKRKELTEEDIMKIIKRGLKSRQEALPLFLQGNRQDLAAKTRSEIKILETYLPQQLSTEELEKIVSKTIAELGATTAKDIGRVMKTVMNQYGRQVNGKEVQQLVASKLHP